jgi:hypothetical protein
MALKPEDLVFVYQHGQGGEALVCEAQTGDKDWMLAMRLWQEEAEWAWRVYWRWPYLRYPRPKLETGWGVAATLGEAIAGAITMLTEMGALTARLPRRKSGSAKPKKRSTRRRAGMRAA